jgi:DNA polymerase V
MSRFLEWLMPFITNLGNAASLSKSSKRIALVDCNNFYASCERVFRPDWKHRPLGVLSNNDGCIIARSNELKEAGIPMGAPYFKHKEQLQKLGAVIVSSNYALYGDMSRRVMSTLAQCVPDMEIYSIDEAWLDMSGFTTKELHNHAQTIVSKVEQYTGIPVSLGIGCTKVRAKLANRLCKKHKVTGSVFDLEAQANQHSLLSSIEVGDIWGIGRKLGSSLKGEGIHTAQQLHDACPHLMRRRYNVVMQRIVMELRGISCLLEEDIEPKKQIIVSRSFGKRVTTLEELEEAIAVYTSRAAEKLRSQESVCSMMHVSLRTGRHNPHDPYYANSAAIQFATANSDTRRLIQAAKQLVRSIYRENYRYAKAGVMLYDIASDTNMQSNLFAMPDSPKSQLLMQTMDALNHRFGKNAIACGYTNTPHTWAMQRNNVSPSYATEWMELRGCC